MSWFMDLDLARRLERTEGAVSASFPPVKQRVAPGSDATWHDFAGTYAIFDGVDSPMTQTFGLGLFDAATPALLSDIEAFFEQRGAPVMHEVSPLAGVETFALLTDRGYRPLELSTVLAQGIEGTVGAPASHDLRARRMEPADRPAWVDASVAGWANDPTFAAIMRSLAEVVSVNEAMLHFLVERDGAPIATGSMGIHDGVALLAGASTIPSERGRGTQAILLAARLAEARRQRCEIAMMVATPGSTSQRNAERNGFRVAYTRTKWRLARPAS